MTSIESLTLDVADPEAAHRFYTKAFGLGAPLRFRTVAAPTTGFRGFTLSLTVSRPADVRSFVDAARDAGATLARLWTPTDSNGKRPATRGPAPRRRRSGRP